jgi:signal transduction histidine kinase
MKKIENWIFSSRIFNANLRTKVSLIFVLPMLITLSITFYIHTFQEWDEWQEMTTATAVQVGDITLASLQHAMLLNDRSMIANILSNIGGQGLTNQVWLVNLNGEVIQSSNPADVGKLVQIEQSGCIECHQLPGLDRPRSIRLTQVQDYLRVSVPIQNAQECQTCHETGNTHLGVLLVDTSLAGANVHFRDEMKLNLVITVLSLAIILLLVYLMVRWLIERRIGLIADSLSAFASGDHSIRVPKIWHSRDEITALADTFNSMADQLSRQEQDVEERTHVRERAIAEERERIGRELHDGIAQFLGYVNTKSQAARVSLEKDQVQKAMEYLRNIEEETRKQAMDIRGSILGLKAFTQPGRGLSYDVEDYLIQSNRFMDVQVEADIDIKVNQFYIDGETRLQFLRILQEAISNIRKHSQAKHAWVSLKMISATMLEMLIRDDGVGFDQDVIIKNAYAHFGLATMQERAKSISADFEVSSGYNRGTTVRVRLMMSE